ncbi:hypothetical protein G4V62_13825 [Bacillaceae bacterium SIJ1]|uniref:hypothetical protein n=1 Tax=Litoribacterium kuwaitense TaxID=1398745 RepID=UPI0013EC73C8|nr:hypothetical protein [Litoribacterium kuwaitense]NGP45973.1 hypothetical protein [Litoribacterium kuwaitense]
MSPEEQFYQDILTLAGVEDSPVYRLEVDAALEYANQYCKTNYTKEDAPAGFKKGIAVLVASAEQMPNVASESVAGELSVSYDTNTTATASHYLKPYVRVVFH